MFTSRRITTTGGDKFKDEFSLEFDGDNDYIDLGSQSGDLRLSGSDGAIVAWIKPALTGDEYQRIVDKSDGGNGTNGYALFVKKDGNLTGNISGASKVVSPAGVVAANKWSHIVWTWNGTTHYIYVNGIEVQSNSSSTRPPSDTTNMRIGTWNHDVAREYKDKMSEVAIYNIALTASQVKTIYNGRESYNHKEGIAPSNLLGWWRMGDGRLDGGRERNSNLQSDDSSQDNIISDEVDSTLGPELYTHANSLSTNEADDQSTGISAMASATLVDETSITNSSSRSLKYIATGNGQGVVVDLTSDVDLTPGEIYRISVDARHTGSGLNHTIRICEHSGLSTTGETLVMGVVSSGQTTFQTYVGYFIHNDTTTRYFGTRESGADNDGGLYLDNLSIKKVNGNPGIINNINSVTFSGDTP
jgi:hypothetical protein